MAFIIKKKRYKFQVGFINIIIDFILLVNSRFSGWPYPKWIDRGQFWQGDPFCQGRNLQVLKTVPVLISYPQVRQLDGGSFQQTSNREEVWSH